MKKSILRADSPDKANPSVKRGRRAAGLFREKDGRAAEGFKSQEQKEGNNYNQYFYLPN